MTLSFFFRRLWVVDKGTMLTEKENNLLSAAFGEHDVEELTLQKAEHISAETKLPVKLIEYYALKNNISVQRYQRNLGTVGFEGQTKLLESRVVIVGLGGLGGYVLEELSRIGVGYIVGIDHDVFDQTNLNRQILSSEQNLGKSKVEEALTRVKAINSTVEFTSLASNLDKVDVQVYHNCNLVFDCLDNIQDRLKLAKICLAANIPLLHGAIGGWYGQVGVIWPGDNVLEKMYENRKSGIEKQLGTPPFTAATCASIMTAKGVKLLTGQYKKQKEEILFFDLLNDQWQPVSF